MSLMLLACFCLPARSETKQRNMVLLACLLCLLLALLALLALHALLALVSGCAFASMRNYLGSTLVYFELITTISTRFKLLQF